MYLWFNSVNSKNVRDIKTAKLHISIITDIYQDAYDD